MLIREATPDDWPGIWPFMRQIVTAGETYAWDPGISEERARSTWFRWRDDPRGCTLVAVDADGAVLGTAETGPNYGGHGAHVAGASFMVDPARSGRGVGRALGERVLRRNAEAGFRAMVFNAVVETNTGAVALWRSLGFEVLATIPGAFRHPVRGYVGLHVMYRPL